MKSPLTLFAHERLPSIGHNQGPPLEPGRSFRQFAWKKARAELMPRLPLEVLKRRVARAKELGLEYPQYASILLGTGRDVVAFLFTSEAIGMRLQRGLELPEPTRLKLSEITGCDRLLMSPPMRDSGEISRLLAEQHRIPFRAVSPSPLAKAGVHAGRAAIRTLLDPLKLPGSKVVMIGADACERSWADSARLAKFLPAETFFRS